MASKANPAVIGGFVLGAVALLVAGLAIFGGGKFFRPTQRWVAYFDESTKGLAIGAPVTFRGVKVGAVIDIRVVVDRASQALRIPVIFEIESSRISESGGGEVQFAKDRVGAKLAIEQGARAQLELQSFVTGQLSINIDIHPGSPMKLVGASTQYPEFPTIPSTMAALGQSLNDLNVAEMGQDFRRVVQGVDRLVNSPEGKQVLVSAVAALEGANKLAATADASLVSLRPLLEKMSANLHQTLETIRTLAQHVDSQTVPAMTGAFRDAGQLARRLDAETVPAVTQVVTDVRPLVEEFVKTVEAARAALEQAQTTLATAQEAVDDRSPLQFQIQTTLQEVSGAARAIRTLSNYLERHPEAVLFGKGGK